MKILFSLLNQEIILSPTTPIPSSFMTSLPLLHSCPHNQHNSPTYRSICSIIKWSHGAKFPAFCKFYSEGKKSETLASAVIPKGENDSCFNIWEVMSLVSSAKEP